MTRELLFLIARSQVNVTECPPNSNAGLKVEEYLALCGFKAGAPWCAAFISWVGRTAWGDHWPLKMTASTVAMLEDGRKKGYEVTGPRTGGLFFVWHAELNRVAHVGLILGPAADNVGWRTVEGNTSGGGSREGWGVFERVRTFKPGDRFLYFDARPVA